MCLLHYFTVLKLWEGKIISWGITCKIPFVKTEVNSVNSNIFLKLLGVPWLMIETYLILSQPPWFFPWIWHKLSSAHMYPDIFLQELCFCALPSAGIIDPSICHRMFFLHLHSKSLLHCICFVRLTRKANKVTFS